MAHGERTMCEQTDGGALRLRARDMNRTAGMKRVPSRWKPRQEDAGEDLATFLRENPIPLHVLYGEECVPDREMEEEDPWDEIPTVSEGVLNILWQVHDGFAYLAGLPECELDGEINRLKKLLRGILPHAGTQAEKVEAWMSTLTSWEGLARLLAMRENWKRNARPLRVLIRERFGL